MSYDYVDSLPPEDKGRYLTKIELLGLDKCPFKLPADRWINDPKQWPKIEYSDVYHYLIKSPRLYSPEAMENYRSTDAHKFFVAGWVQTVFHIKLDSGDILFKADVKRSYCVTDTPHHSWVALKKSGPVIYGHCDCMAGLGETCSHVGAMLYKMEAAVRLGYTSSACTDLPCQWNACFVQHVQPSPIANIRFYKDAAKARLKKSTKKLKTTPDTSTQTEQHDFLSALANLSESAVGLSTFSEFNDRFIGLGPSEKTSRLPQPLRNLYVNGNEKVCQEKIALSVKEAADNFKLGKEEIEYVEEVTRAQSASTVWHDQRVGRITSSTVSDILRTDLNKPAPSLLKKICQANMAQIKVPSIEWGNRNEHNAYLLYENLYTGTGHKPDVVPNGVILATNPGPHQDCKVSKSGFVISEERPFLGVSPDGYVKCLCCGNGLLEIKCPFKHRDSNLQEAIADEQFYISSQHELKQNHRYYAQVQLQMLVCEVNYIDFLVWTPIDCLITRVKRNNLFIEKMVPKLESVWHNHILPELVSRKLESGMDKENVIPGSSHHSSDRQTFCLCKTTEDEGPMVACDLCDQWYHPACVGLKRLPSKKVWYCKDCRKLKKGK